MVASGATETSTWGWIHPQVKKGMGVQLWTGDCSTCKTVYLPYGPFGPGLGSSKICKPKIVGAESADASGSASLGQGVPPQRPGGPHQQPAPVFGGLDQAQLVAQLVLVI